MPRYIDADLIPYTESEDGVLDDFAYRYDINEIPTADVAPKSEEGVECHICHGTGRIGTTDWLTKNMTKKQLAEEKAKAIAEHEQHIKSEVAREIFAEIYKSVASKIPVGIRHIFKDDMDFDVGFINGKRDALLDVLVLTAELKKKYTEGQT